MWLLCGKCQKHIFVYTKSHRTDWFYGCQRKLADLLYMQRTTYHNYETGKREVPLELAVTLAKFYNVSLDYIAGLTNDPMPRNDNNKKNK